MQPGQFVVLNFYNIWSGVACTWWRHQMETFSALLAICAGNSPVITKAIVTQSFDVFFDIRLNQQLSKQWKRRWSETPSRSLWRHCNGSMLEYRYRTNLEHWIWNDRLPGSHVIQIKICAEYRDMLPRPRLVCQEPGLRPIGRSPGLPDKSSRGLGSMSFILHRS